MPEASDIGRKRSKKRNEIFLARRVPETGDSDRTRDFTKGDVDGEYFALIFSLTPAMDLEDIYQKVFHTRPRHHLPLS